MHPANPPVRSTAPDLGAAIKMPFEDPQWISKGLIMGLIYMFVPVVGWLVVFGWCREIYERTRRGEAGLPDLSFGRHMSEGVAPFVAVMNLMVPIIGMMMVFGVGIFALAGIAEVGGDAAEVLGPLFSLGMIGFQMFFMLLIFGFQLLTPELMRRGFNGELGPLFSPGASLVAIKTQPMNYFITFLGMMVANIIGSLGMFACYVGMFVTMPLGLAMTAHLLAQWDRLVRGGDHSLADTFR